MAPHRYKYVEETLAWVNEERAKCGMGPLDDLPKGTRRAAETCPLSIALGSVALDVGGESWAGLDDDRPLPRCARRFVSAFDAGKLPEYEVSRQ